MGRLTGTLDQIAEITNKYRGLAVLLVAVLGALLFAYHIPGRISALEAQVEAHSIEIQSRASIIRAVGVDLCLSRSPEFIAAVDLPCDQLLRGVPRSIPEAQP